MGFTPQFFLVNVLCLVGMGKESDEIIGEACEEIVKKEKAKILIERIRKYKIWSERPRKLEGSLGEIQKRGGGMAMTGWWNGMSGRTIICMRWLITIKRKPSRLQINL